MYSTEQIEKAYDYINRVTQTQGRLLDKATLYGDGSIYEFDKQLFNAVYDAIAQTLKSIK